MLCVSLVSTTKRRNHIDMHPTQFLELTRIKFKGDTHVFDVMLELGNLIHDACNSCGIDGFLKPMGHLISI